MTLQAFKDAEFESSNLRVIPVNYSKIGSLSALPLFSYGFQIGDEPPFKLFYDAIAKKETDRVNSLNSFRVIAKQMVNSMSGLGVRLVSNNASYWDNDIQFLAQTMQNMFTSKLRAGTDSRRVDGAAIHGLGAVYIPLEQGAMMRINQPDYDERCFMDWDIIIRGEINFLGDVRPFAIHHAHCQGFEFPDIDVIMEEAMAGLFKWFPFLERHVAVINCAYVSNPVTHQDRL